MAQILTNTAVFIISQFETLITGTVVRPRSVGAVLCTSTTISLTLIDVCACHHKISMFSMMYIIAIPLQVLLSDNNLNPWSHEQE